MTPLLTKIWFYYTLSTFSVGTWLNHYEVKYPDVVLRQSILETGWYKCTNCSLRYNNIFGFSTGKYLQFDNWIESVEYYKKWQDKYMPEVCSKNEYYEWLDRYGYASAKDYIKTLKQIKI